MRLERFLKQHQQLEELSKRVLEINPKHALIRQMAALAAGAGQRGRRSATSPSCCSIRRGSSRASPCPTRACFSRRMSAFLAKGLAA